MICGLFGKTRQAHYKRKWMEDKLVLKHAIIIKTVEEIRIAMPRVGTRKLKFLLDNKLRKHGIEISRDKLFDLLSDYGLLIRRRRKRRTITTDSTHPFKKYPNLIRELLIICPNQLWVSDITYISLTNSYCYLSLVTDAYSRKIVGFCLYATLEKEGPLNALQMALAGYKQDHKRPLIHHSDRGLQYCCRDYIAMLMLSHASISMTEKGDPYENAIAERVNGILKSEFLLNRTFKNYDEAHEAVKVAVVTYNDQRPHGSCDYLTPEEAHQKEGMLQKRWKPQNEGILQ
jgi:putative transposase